MSCNRDGVQCQPAAHAVGGGDTELVQMSGRRSGGNCPQCGQFMPAGGGHTCPTPMSPDYSSIAVALNKAIAADERRNFIIVDGVENYFPMGQNLEVGVAQVEALTQNGGTAALYVYEKNPHRANDPRRPVAIFHDGQPAMVTETARTAVDTVDWRKTGWTIHDIMDRLDQQSEIPTAGAPADVFARLGRGAQSEELQHTLNDVRETVAARADAGVGFTAKDAIPLIASYRVALDRRIEAQAGPAMAAVYEELGQGYWEGGYTEDEVSDGCEKLNKIASDVFGLPGEIGVMWNENDQFSGFSGDSELVYLHQRPADPDNPDGGTMVEAYSLPSPFYADSDPADFIADLRRIARREARPDTVYPGDEVTSDNYNWGPWHEPDNDWGDVEDDDWEDEAPWDLGGDSEDDH
jgi:hypothetical protein